MSSVLQNYRFIEYLSITVNISVNRGLNINKIVPSKMFNPIGLHKMSGVTASISSA